MYTYENIPVEWFTSGRRSRSSYFRPPPMSRPVSKSFNRISDFIFPDTVHIRFPPPPPQQQQFSSRRYHRTDNYSLPVLNQRDFIVVEHLPAEEFDNVDLLYREQYYQPNRQVRRRYSSYFNEHRIPSHEKMSIPLANRSAAYRERIRDRRKRHTTDNAYHSMLKSMLEEDEQQQYKDPNYILSYRTTLDPITDSESMTSIHQQKQQKSINNISHSRVPINGTIPIINERQRQYSSSISSRDSSSDTDITERHPITNDSTVWERLPSNSIHNQHQPDRFIPINPSTTDTNNHETMSYSNNLINSSPFDNVINDPINNQDSTHHVSLCVNDLRTTLFIDEDTLKNTKTMNNGGKTVIKTFIDRIIKRLQHFKRSLDNGLIHVRKRNNLVNGSIVSADYQSHNKITKTKTNIDQSLDSVDDNKLVRPYFLIRPQTVLMLPNETAKFKCCFGGDPLPNLIWSHNESRIPEILATGNPTSSRYQTHKLHGIYYLDIRPVNLKDNGQIKCTIMNKFGREEAIAQLFVVPSPADATPCITQTLNDITIIEGQPLKLSCSIIGLQVTVNWFHNGKLISSTTQGKNDYKNENAVFTLSRCMRSDAGTVDCLVKNRFGEARTSCRIEIINDPQFDRTSRTYQNVYSMISLSEDRLFHYIDLSKTPQCKNIKFKRAFQFLQLLLIQRVYGIDVITRPSIRRSSKQHEFEVFLGGSCNPTTWRYEQAIPYFQSHSISYYNPQVKSWTPDLVEIEHRAKELALLLFFVIVHNTRSLAAIAETCYLAARGRNIIVVMNRMPEDKNQAKFIQQKNSSNENDNKKDYDNACEARRTLRLLLQGRNIPVFDNIKVALECAAFFIENISEDTDRRRSITNLSPFVRSMNVTTGLNIRRTSNCTKTQISFATNESDDDGYGSLGSGNLTLSRSSSSIFSDLCEYSDHQYENKYSRFYTLCTFPYRFIKRLLLPHASSVTNHFERSTSFIFDLYIASGDQDEIWLNTFVFPLLKEINVKYTKREISYDNDQLDIIYDNHIRKRSRLLYYLINDNERLSHLTTELAFLIGERQHHIIVCLQSTINENSEEILTKNERQDIERSRKYLDDLAKKEKILLYQSREQSCQHVLAFFLQD